MTALRIDTVRGRLTAFYITALAAALIIVGGLIYVLLARALYARIDDGLYALVQITVTSLTNDLGEGQDVADAARSTAAELSSRQQMLAIYDDTGRLLAEGGRDEDLNIALPPLETIPTADAILQTVIEEKDQDDRHRLALRRVIIPSHNAKYIVVAGGPLEPIDEELESLRAILAYVVPIALMLAGIGGWFLARQSLSPVATMVDRARKMSAENLSGRLPVSNPRDELGRLAETFNDLLSRLEASITAQRQVTATQRQFMADASHELRTPVTTTRTAANVALQQLHRDEPEYRETLAIIEQQATRLSRIVDDMFTLARADAGTYPVRQMPMYLDEVVDEVVKAARVLAATRDVSIEPATVPSAAFTGDEDLIRRLMVNLLDNAIRYAPPSSMVRVQLERAPGGYALSISDRGPGIPADAQPHIFERFYRADAARTRRENPDDGAGLGLALGRWIAEAHGGHLTLARSSDAGTTFTAFLPVPG
jgi:two-component system, OmpR family, sensor kinase